MTPPYAAQGFHLPGDRHVLVEGSDELVQGLTRALDPCAAGPHDGGEPILAIRQRSAGLPPGREQHNLAGDGWRTASSGGRLYVVNGSRACSVPAGDGLIEVQAGFPLRQLMRVARPALQMALLEKGIPVLHAACAEVDGRGVLVAGWSESGKTETMLSIVESGGRFLSDKWTLLLPGPRCGVFPIGVGVRGWVLPYLPTLWAGLPPAARAQLRAASLLAAGTTPLRVRQWRGRVGHLADLATRTVGLADRAGLTPSQVRATYAEDADPLRTPPIGLVAVLRNEPSSAVTVHEGDPARLATRLAVSAATEREPYMALQRRVAYAEARQPRTDDVLARDAAAIRAVLTAVRLIEVTAPFPTDPRRVADAIAARL